MSVYSLRLQMQAQSINDCLHENTVKQRALDIVNDVNRLSGKKLKL